MIKNWLIISLRSFWSNKVYSLINMTGLTLGLAVSMLIFIYVKHEFSYDNFHEHKDFIYQLISESQADEDDYMGINRIAVFAAPLADVIKESISGVDQVTRMVRWGVPTTAEIDGKTVFEDYCFTADASLFKSLTFQILSGSSENILERPFTMAISESTALKWFGQTDVAGTVVPLTSRMDLGQYTIDVVFKDFPTNSSFQFNVITRYEDFIKIAQPHDLGSWDNSNANYFMQLSESATTTSIETQLENYFRRRYEGTADAVRAKRQFSLEPLTRLYLSPDTNWSILPRNDRNRLYMLGTIAIFVLVMAGVNYVNLATARSITRAKEVGIRKVTGALRNELITQFLTDAILLAYVAMILAVPLVWLSLPVFRDFIGKEIPFDFYNDYYLVAFVLGTPFLLGLAGGLYPAVSLSGFAPSRALKGSYARSKEGSFVRDVLVVLQFALSGGLIIAALVVGQQLRYIETNDPGYNRENVVVVYLTDEGVRAKYESFQAALEQHPQILATSVSSYLPHKVGTQQSRHWKSANEVQDVSFFTAHVDYNYLKVFDLTLVAGRNFSRDIKTDKNAYLINETAAQVYGWADPVGMEFTGDNGIDTVKIIGVIKDFHFSSYRQPIKPLRLGMLNDWVSVASVRVRPGRMQETLAFIEKTYKELATGKNPYRFTFFDEQFQNVYKTDQQLGKLISFFALVAIVIACLGLYALSVYTVTMRLKEIGVRKTLGGSLFHIVYLLSRKQLTLVVIAFCITAPIAHVLMQKWLSTFVYHISISAMLLGIGLLILLIITIVTIAHQTLKAANVNPAGILKYE